VLELRRSRPSRGYRRGAKARAGCRCRRGWRGRRRPCGVAGQETAKAVKKLPPRENHPAIYVNDRAISAAPHAAALASRLASVSGIPEKAKAAKRRTTATAVEVRVSPTARFGRASRTRSRLSRVRPRHSTRRGGSSVSATGDPVRCCCWKPPGRHPSQLVGTSRKLHRRTRSRGIPAGPRGHNPRLGCRRRETAIRFTTKAENSIGARDHRRKKSKKKKKKQKNAVRRPEKRRC